MAAVLVSAKVSVFLQHDQQDFPPSLPKGSTWHKH